MNNKRIVLVGLLPTLLMASCSSPTVNKPSLQKYGKLVDEKTYSNALDLYYGSVIPGYNTSIFSIIDNVEIKATRSSIQNYETTKKIDDELIIYSEELYDVVIDQLSLRLIQENELKRYVQTSYNEEELTELGYKKGISYTKEKCYGLPRNNGITIYEKDTQRQKGSYYSLGDYALSIFNSTIPSYIYDYSSTSTKYYINDKTLTSVIVTNSVESIGQISYLSGGFKYVAINKYMNGNYYSGEFSMFTTNKKVDIEL